MSQVSVPGTDPRPESGRPAPGRASAADSAPPSSAPPSSAPSGGAAAGGPADGLPSSEPSSSPDKPENPDKEPSVLMDHLIRIAGIVISVVAAICTAVLELITTTVRVGAVPIGVSIPLAVVGNLAIAWFAVVTTRRRWAFGPPWAVWTLLMFLAAGVRRPEGDYLLSGDNWIALVMILVGSLTFAVYSYRVILRRPTVTKS